MRPLRVLMVTDHAREGGAGIAASRLRRGLEADGCEVERVAIHHAATSGAIELPGSGLRDRIKRKLVGAPRPERVAGRFEGILRRLHPDVINLHNLHGGIPWGWSLDLVDLSAACAPTVWTLHDSWSFTGSCASTLGCERWTTGCDERCTCPADFPRLQAHRLRAAYDDRKALLARRPELVAVAPSAWMAERASASLWRGHEVRQIPNGLDLQVFRPRESEEVRRSLGVPSGHRMIVASAVDLSSPWKGGHLLSEALASIRSALVTLVLLGRNAIGSDRTDIPVRSVGFVEGEEKLASIYAAADLVVHPGLEDNYPNVVAEALACGTPVVGFRSGGMPELVMDGVNGWLSGDTSAEALAAAIDVALEDPEALRLRATEARRLALGSLDLGGQTRAYVGLFHELIAGANAS